jgi:hypothetical protein
MSATARAQRRGGISQMEFRAEMDRLGFVEIPPRSEWLHEFRHPDMRSRRFGIQIAIPESYSAALKRAEAVVRSKRQWGSKQDKGVNLWRND